MICLYMTRIYLPQIVLLGSEHGFQTTTQKTIQIS